MKKSKGPTRTFSRRGMRLGVTGLLFLAFVCFSLPSSASAEMLAQPFVVVELFTSEGCSSCPPADRLLTALTEIAAEQKKRIFTLGFHVDYWNYLGWEDRFSSKEFTARQRGYARELGSNVYTPQMVVNGRVEFGGYRRDLALQSIEDALKMNPEAVLSIGIKNQEGDSVTVAYEAEGFPPESYIRAVVIENNLRTDVKSGENRGKTLTHSNIVRKIRSVPARTSGEIKVMIPRDVDLYQAAIVAFIQRGQNGPILAAEKIEIGDSARVSEIKTLSLTFPGPR